MSSPPSWSLKPKLGPNHSLVSVLLREERDYTQERTSRNRGHMPKEMPKVKGQADKKAIWMFAVWGTICVRTELSRG